MSDAQDGGPAETGGSAVPRVRDDGLVEADPAEPVAVRRRGRRVSTGSTGAPSREPSLERQQSTENDDRLRGDKPPHWG